MSEPSAHNPFNRPLHRAALATATLVFPLIWLGGLVTTHGAGMSVPDWPNSYGYNMFALPFGRWLGANAGGAFFEHTHRLLGSLVGLAALVATMIAWGPSVSPAWRRRWGTTSLACLTFFVVSLSAARAARSTGVLSEDAYKLSTHLFSTFASLAIAAGICWACRSRDPSRGRRWLVTALLGVVIVQGLMGGFRVDKISLTLAKLHGIFGQITFAFAAIVATATSRWWTTRDTRPIAEGKILRRHAVIALAFIALQLSLGALMRHDPHREANAAQGDGSAGLAIPDWPLQYGHVLPPISDVALAAVNEHRLWDLHWPAVTMFQVWLHFAHRCGAYLTTLAVLAVTFVAWRRHRDDAKVVWPATILAGLVLAQVTLGVTTVLTRKAADVATAHQATGALLLMTCGVLAARAFRLYCVPSAAAVVVAPGATRVAPPSPTFPRRVDVAAIES